MGKNLITAEVLAKYLDMSVETIWRYTREKKIPVVQLGDRAYRYCYDDVLAALSGQVHEERPHYNNSRKLTYQDYLELPEEPGCRHEILDGQLIKEPSPNIPHQRVSRRLHRTLEDYFWQVDPAGEVFSAPLDVTLGKHTVVQPDLLYVAGNQQEIVKHTRIDGAPLLIVEVLSPATSRKDRLQKREMYQAAGIRHYWLADPQQQSLECYQLQQGSYILAASSMDDELLRHPAFQGLGIDLGKLWK